MPLRAYSSAPVACYHALRCRELEAAATDDNENLIIMHRHAEANRVRIEDLEARIAAYEGHGCHHLIALTSARATHAAASAASNAEIAVLKRKANDDTTEHVAKFQRIQGLLNDARAEVAQARAATVHAENERDEAKDVSEQFCIERDIQIAQKNSYRRAYNLEVVAASEARAQLKSQLRKAEDQ